MKRNLTFSKLVMLVVMAILPLTFYAQEGKSKKPVEKYWYIFGEGGFSINHGDLANYTGWIFEDLDKDYFLKNLNGQIGVGYQFGGVIGLNGKFGAGSLSGYKKSRTLPSSTIRNSSQKVHLTVLQTCRLATMTMIKEPLTSRPT